jgi:ABC-type transporter Mla MlaB component
VDAMHEPSTPRRDVVLAVRGRITDETVPHWCARVADLLADPGVGAITCDLSGVVRPDVTALDALARMQLVARRLGRTIRLRHASTDMCALLTLAGLTDVLPPADLPTDAVP